MSYDLMLGVKVDGLDQIVCICEPALSSPTYNLGKMFRQSTGWDYEQGEWYKCADVIGNIEQGIRELRTKPSKYKLLEPDNGWGTLGDAIQVLESLRDCIYETAENVVPLEHLYVRW